jgi:hypothetical protein
MNMACLVPLTQHASDTAVRRLERAAVLIIFIEPPQILFKIVPY